MRHYHNLANVYLMRDDFAPAEEMLHEALKIVERLGDLEECAKVYGTLGRLHQNRGDLAQAEAMHHKCSAYIRSSMLPSVLPWHTATWA